MFAESIEHYTQVNKEAVVPFMNSKCMCVSQAIPMFEESLKHHQQLDNTESVADAYNNLGLVHLENSDPQQALPYLQQSLEVRGDCV